MATWYNKCDTEASFEKLFSGHVPRYVTATDQNAPYNKLQIKFTEQQYQQEKAAHDKQSLTFAEDIY